MHQRNAGWTSPRPSPGALDVATDGDPIGGRRAADRNTLDAATLPCQPAVSIRCSEPVPPQLGWTRLQVGDPRGYGPSVPVIAGARATGAPNRRLHTHSSTVVDALWTITTFRTGASGQRVGSEGGAAG